MSHVSRPFTCFALLCALSSWSAFAAQPAATTAAKPVPPTVILQTSLGDIHIALDVEHAPNTSKNFLAYVDSGRFDGVTFYRRMQSRRDGTEGMVQAGLRGRLGNALPPVPHESTVTTGLSHIDGAVSMARPAIPGSARGDFFIVVGGIPSYDGVPNGGDPGFAVFGKVSRGMSVVRKILRMPTSQDAANPRMQGQMLVEPVTILSAKRAP